jgi:putative transposase
MTNEDRSRKTERNGSAGFQPVSFFQTTRRRLPHWQQGGSVYFISWVCRSGQTLDPAEKNITMEAIRFWDARKWTVYAAVVMPDHVHLLVQPLAGPDGRHTNLGEIIHSVKSFSAQRINRSRGVRGSLWQVERYDRIVRDEAEFLEKWQYIRNNPVKAGFVERPEDYPWLFEKHN